MTNLVSTNRLSQAAKHPEETTLYCSDATDPLDDINATSCLCSSFDDAWRNLPSLAKRYIRAVAVCGSNHRLYSRRGGRWTRNHPNR